MIRSTALLRAAFAAAAIACTAPALAQMTAVTQTPGRLAIIGYAAPVPTGWQSERPASAYRAAQYRVPAAKGAAAGEVIVFYFGKGQGGPAAANIERWVSEFSSPEGKPVTPQIGSLNVAGMKTTTVELNGTYARGAGMGQQIAGRPNQTLLVAIIETPEGNVTFQLHGDRQTVDAHRKSFDAMVRGFKKAG